MKYSYSLLSAVLSILLLASSCSQDKPSNTSDATQSTETTETPKENTSTPAAPVESTSATDTEQKAISSANNTLTASTYTEFPTGVDRCSCRYAASKAAFEKGEWLHTYDSKITGFMTIEGKMNDLRMSQSLDRSDGSSERKFSNADFNVVVDVSQVGKVKEVVQHSGIITVTDNKGKTYTSTVYGECGC
ncbi:MAG: hypothetical protein AB8F74_09350 [Saprospiraceae bacterium]